MEYIFEITEILSNEDTGGAVFKPKVTGELIRCKDCKHFNFDEYGGEDGNRCCITEHECADDDFCSWAERKKESVLFVWRTTMGDKGEV